MTRLEKWSVLGSSALTGVTGLGFLWVKYAMEPADPWAVINHPIEPWLLKSHILFAPLLVFAVGMIAVRHIWRHYRSGMEWGRKTGIISALSLAPMVFTGYLIQAVTEPSWLSFVAISHIVTSLIFLAALTVHAVILARRLGGRNEALKARNPPARAKARAAAGAAKLPL